MVPFPDDVIKAVQYGKRVKAHSVYMSQFQLISYNRVRDYFKEQLQISISDGSIYNFNRKAYDLLVAFEEKANRNWQSQH
ncbi:MAG: hypothetical protein GY775_09215 [Candidatus Scalindua sp.]|nr:hypothetical protein [Candidatus Scalindua sp.]